MSVNVNQHRHLDTNLSVRTAMPAADGAADYSTGIDLRSGGSAITVAGSQTAAFYGNAALQDAEAMIRADATATLVNTKSLVFGLQDSDDDSSYAAIDGLTTQTVTGTAGNVSAETDLRWKLPSSVRRYLRASAICPADGGDVTAYYFTLYIVT